MQCVILAAGLGTRMGDLTKEIPKPLLKVGEESILGHDLRALPPEIDEVIVVVGYLGEQIRQQFGASFAGKRITYAEQKELKGTAHALSLCKELLHERFLVFHGDDIYEANDLQEMVRRPLALLAWEMKIDELESDRHALVKTDKDGQLLDIVERQPAAKGELVNTGAYVLDKSFFDYPLAPAVVPAGEFGLPQTFLQMVRAGAKFDIVRATFWHKVASAEDLREPSPTRSGIYKNGPPPPRG